MISADGERAARLERDSAQPAPILTPAQLAAKMRDGFEPSDGQIRQWHAERSPLWHVAIDETYRAELLAPPMLALPTGPSVVIRATRRDAHDIGASLARLERVLASPMRPVYGPKGELLGAQREIPDEHGEPIPSPPGPRSVSFHDLSAVADVFLDAIQSRDLKIDALTARIAALEAKPQLRYRGVFAANSHYAVGDLTTHAGGMWHCSAPTTDRPGTSLAWVLCVKRGKDVRP